MQKMKDVMRVMDKEKEMKRRFQEKMDEFARKLKGLGFERTQHIFYRGNLQLDLNLNWKYGDLTGWNRLDSLDDLPKLLEEINELEKHNSKDAKEAGEESGGSSGSARRRGSCVHTKRQHHPDFERHAGDANRGETSRLRGR